MKVQARHCHTRHRCLVWDRDAYPGKGGAPKEASPRSAWKAMLEGCSQAWKRRRPSCHQASERRPSHELERSGRLPLQLGRSQQSHLGWRAERCASPPRAERHGSSLHNVGACRGRRGKHGCTQNPDRKSQNPESGIQTKPDKHKWPSFYPDIRTQNPESGIRNPDPSSPHEPACMEGHQNPEPRIRKPETRPQPPEPVRASKQGISEPRTRIP